MKLLSVFMMLWIILIVRNHNLSSMSANYLDINEDGHFAILGYSFFPFSARVNSDSTQLSADMLYVCW